MPCLHCDNDNTNPNFCEFCGRPVQEMFIKNEKKEEIPAQEIPAKAIGNVGKISLIPFEIKDFDYLGKP